MADLIDRKSVIDVVHKAIFDFFDIVDDDDESPMTHKDEQLLKLNKAIVTKIKALPSAERHGEWIQKSTSGESFYTCSRCGFIAWEHEDTNYCPNCGADMGGEHSG